MEVQQEHAFAEDDSQLREQLSEARARFQVEHQRILGELRARRVERARFVEMDAAVRRVLELQRLARKSGPVRALAMLSQLLDRVEAEYGPRDKEKSARESLGYGSSQAERISKPANNPAYRARHEGKKDAEAVPPDVLAEALAAADDIGERFIRARLASWRANEAHTSQDSPV
jgi:hypothetical protein